MCMYGLLSQTNRMQSVSTSIGKTSLSIGSTSLANFLCTSSPLDLGTDANRRKVLCTIGGTDRAEASTPAPSISAALSLTSSSTQRRILSIVPVVSSQSRIPALSPICADRTLRRRGQSFPGHDGRRDAPRMTSPHLSAKARRSPSSRTAWEKRRNVATVTCRCWGGYRYTLGRIPPPSAPSDPAIRSFGSKHRRTRSRNRPYGPPRTPRGGGHMATTTRPKSGP
mmetsp:Transcript_6209/g.13001  ORF Transcript_6209/g.13001 Transcript_6209/m.13001 type:complete len:225 (+) Transcript_6209:240-914(+)